MPRYIDADELKNHLIKNRGYVLGPLLHPLLEDIDNQPTVNVHGEWVDLERKYPIEKVACSICGNLIKRELSEEYKYCPNCGADMRGEE